MHQTETNEGDIGPMLTVGVEKSDRARTSRSSKYVTIERVRQWASYKTRRRATFLATLAFCFAYCFDDRYVDTDNIENKQKNPGNLALLRWIAGNWNLRSSGQRERRCHDTNFGFTDEPRESETEPPVRSETAPLLGSRSAGGGEKRKG